MRRLALAAGMCAVLCLAAVAQVRWPSESPPRPLAAHDVRFPAYELRTLPNGMQVVAVLHHEQPVVSIRMLIKAGSALDPRNKLGLARLTASLLDQGTTSKSANELNDAIDFMGAQANAGAGTDLSFVNMIVMKDSFKAGLDMLSDMARHPAFAPEEIERQKQQLLSNLQVSNEDPSYLADGVFDRLVYGFHPYGLPDLGTPDSLQSISRDDVQAFHQQYFVPNNVILAVVGDVTADEAFDNVSRVFGDWTSRDVPKANYATPPDPARRVIIVNKPDAVQTELRVGQIGIRRNHPDYMAVNLAMRILGGEGANRLHQVLRTERGLTYGAEANMHALLQGGDFEAETNTRSDATGEVLRLMVEEFWRLQRDRVGDRELSDAKAYMTGSFPLTIETPDAIATQVLNVVFYGLPIGELQSFRDRVNAVTPDDVQRAARMYLRPDRLSIVLVGNQSVFQSQLKGVGFASFEAINMEDLDLSASDLKRPRGRAGLDGLRSPFGSLAGRFAFSMPAQSVRAFVGRGSGRIAYAAANSNQTSPIVPKEGLTARALLDRLIEAKGGLTTLKGVKTITAITRAEGTTPAGKVSAETTTYLEYPNRVRVETKLPEGVGVQVFDGAHGWLKDPAGVHDIPEPMIRNLREALRRDTIAVLLAARDGAVRVRTLPDVKDDQGRVRNALELSAVDLEPMVLLIDPATGLVEKQTYVGSGAGHPLIEERFSDYKAVDGVQVAFTASVRQGGRPVLERHVVDIHINAPIAPDLFKRPS